MRFGTAKVVTDSILGVDYQPGGSSELEDPLADTNVCERDVKYFQELGINTIRVYSIDNTKTTPSVWIP